MNSIDVRSGPANQPQGDTTKRENRPAPDAMFRRLQWVAHVMQQAGAGTGPRLAWTHPDGSVHQCTIPIGRPLIAGRDAAADVHGDNDRLSRRHYQIAWETDGFWLCDMESRNGTRVNGRRIQHRLLRDGDVIEAGRQHFVFLAR